MSEEAVVAVIGFISKLSNVVSLLSPMWFLLTFPAVRIPVKFGWDDGDKLEAKPPPE